MTFQIVGDPLALVNDDNWRALLAYCVKENAYRGCPCPMLGADKADDAQGDVDSMVRTISLLVRTFYVFIFPLLF